MIDERIAAHEAGHCAGLIFFGHLPKEVRADNPDTRAASSGQVVLDYGDGLTRDMAADWLVAILLGPLCELGRREPWPPAYEDLDPGSPDSDLAALGRLTRFLRTSRERYYGHVAIAAHISHDPDFKAVHALVASALCREPVLDARQLRRLLGPRTLATFHLEEATP